MKKRFVIRGHPSIIEDRQGTKGELNCRRRDLMKWNKAKFANNKIQTVEIQAKIEKFHGITNANHSQREERGLKARLGDH